MAVIQIDMSPYDKIIYVDGTNGSDSNVGSLASPVKTLTAAATLVNSVNTCIYVIGAGAYTVPNLTGLINWTFNVTYVVKPELFGKVHLMLTGCYGEAVVMAKVQTFIGFVIKRINCTNSYYETFSDSSKINLEFKNCYFDETADAYKFYFPILAGTSSGCIIIKLQYTNCSFGTLFAYNFDGATRRGTFVNCSFKNDTSFSSQFANNLYSASHKQFGINGSAWVNTGAGFNPDGSIANIGVLGGTFAWDYDTWYCIKTNVQDMKVGDVIACRYTAPVNTSPGMFSELGTCTQAELTASAGSIDGLFFFVCVGYDFKNRKKLVSDRVINTNIYWRTLDEDGLIFGNDNYNKLAQFYPSTVQMNYNNSAISYYTEPIVFQNDLYVFWQEGNIVRGKKYYQDSWYSIDNSGLNYDTAKIAHNLETVIYHDYLYVFWHETTATKTQIRWRMYDGNTWFADTGALNISTTYDAQGPTSCVYNDELYVFWREINSASKWQIVGKKYNGTSWINVTPGSLNIDNTQSVANGNGYYQDAIVYNNSLYVVWAEYEAGGILQIRGQKFNGIEWTPISSSPLNYDPSQHAYDPQVVIYNSALYVFWREKNGTPYLLMGKKFDGTKWLGIDEGALNYDATVSINSAATLTVYNGELYVFWVENNWVYGKKYDDITWSNLNNSATIGWNASSFYPNAITYNDSVYLFWSDGSNPSVRGKKLSSFSVTGFKYILRSLTGGNYFSQMTENEWDKIIAQSTLGGKILAGDNSMWNWRGMGSFCQEFDYDSYPNNRTARGYDTVSQWNYIDQQVYYADRGYRPVLLLDYDNPPPVINVTSNKEKMYDPNILLTGTIADPNNEDVDYCIKLNSKLIQDFSQLKASPFTVNKNLLLSSGVNTLQIYAKDSKSNMSILTKLLYVKEIEMTHISQANADTNYLNSQNVMNSGNQLFIKVPLDPATGYIKSCSLRLNVTGVAGTIKIAPILQTWNSAGITYNNKPNLDTSAVKSYTVTTASGFVDLDISDLVRYMYTNNLNLNGICLYSSDCDYIINVTGNSITTIYTPTQLLVPQEVYGDRVTLNWKSFVSNKLSDINKVELYRDSSANFYNEVKVATLYDTKTLYYTDKTVSKGVYYYRIKVYFASQLYPSITNYVYAPVPDKGYKNVLTDAVNLLYDTKLVEGIGFDSTLVDYDFYTTPDKIKLKSYNLGNMIGGRDQNVFAVEVINTCHDKNFNITLKFSDTSGVYAEEHATYGLMNDNVLPEGKTKVEMSLDSTFATGLAYPLTFELDKGVKKVVYFKITPTVYSSVGANQIQLRLLSQEILP